MYQELYGEINGFCVECGRGVEMSTKRKTFKYCRNCRPRKNRERKQQQDEELNEFYPGCLNKE